MKIEIKLEKEYKTIILANGIQLEYHGIASIKPLGTGTEAIEYWN